MPGHRIQFTLEQVHKSYAESCSARDMAARLGVAHHTTAQAIARDHGYEVPAPHWGQAGHVNRDHAQEPAPDRLKHEMAVEAAEAKAREATALLSAAKAEIRTQQDFLTAVLDAATEPMPAPHFASVKQDGHKPHRSVVVQISDCQGGQEVHRVDTGGNTYDWDIMLDRQVRFFGGVVGSIKNIMRAYFIDEIVLAYTGDIIEGYKVFSEQGYQLCKDAGAQVVDGGKCWAAFEADLERALPGIPKRRRVVFGNHGLPEGRKGGAVTSTINYEYIWVNFLEALTVNLGIDSEYATEGRLLFEVAGQSCLITHGDELRGQMGIPFYGIRTAWMKHTQELDVLFRYWFFGHIHQTSMVTYGNGAALSCGDWVGYNNLTGKLRNPSSTPMQSVYFLSHERGLDEISYIHLTEAAS